MAFLIKDGNVEQAKSNDFFEPLYTKLYLTSNLSG